MSGRLSRVSVILSLLLLFFALACGSPTEPDLARTIGTLEFFGERGVLAIPDSVDQGESLTVRVETFGGGCDRKGDEDVELAGSVATITVFDMKNQRTEVDCPAILKRFEHVVILPSFEKGGEARIVVRGIREPSGEEVAVERTVVVRGRE